MTLFSLVITLRCTTRSWDCLSGQKERVQQPQLAVVRHPETFGNRSPQPLLRSAAHSYSVDHDDVVNFLVASSRLTEVIFFARSRLFFIYISVPSVIAMYDADMRSWPYLACYFYTVIFQTYPMAWKLEN